MSEHAPWGIDPSGYCNCDGCESADEFFEELCDECGKVRDSFACKIRHLHLQSGWARGDH